MKKSLPSFTLMEMMVAMILSGILTAFVYGSYLAVQGYYLRITKASEAMLSEKVALSRVRKDVSEARWILEDGNGFLCVRPGRQIRYANENGSLFRRLNGKTDTLISSCGLTFKTVKFDSVDTELIGFISLRVWESCDSVNIFKQYFPTDFSTKPDKSDLDAQ